MQVGILEPPEVTGGGQQMLVGGAGQRVFPSQIVCDHQPHGAKRPHRWGDEPFGLPRLSSRSRPHVAFPANCDTPSDVLVHPRVECV